MKTHDANAHWGSGVNLLVVTRVWRPSTMLTKQDAYVLWGSTVVAIWNDHPTTYEFRASIVDQEYLYCHYDTLLVISTIQVSHTHSYIKNQTRNKIHSF